jgi:hypothetical protein
MMTEIEVVKQAIKNVDKKALLQVKIIVFAYSVLVLTCGVLYSLVLQVGSHTVRRPHAGLCHPYRMVLDQMVRGGEHFALALRNVKYQHGQGKKCSGTNRSFSFPELQISRGELHFD